GVSERQIVMQRLPVHRPRNPMAQERLDLGGEEDEAVASPEIERLLAESVAAEQQSPSLPVPEREREHSAQMVDAGIPVAVVGGEDDLRVALRDESAASRLEPTAKLAEVVDLAVEHDVEAPVRAAHRLAAGDEIDDGQARHAEPHAGLDVKTRIVGAAMLENLQHPR